jgi:5-methylcytosine-specific restriction enzyme A
VSNARKSPVGNRYRTGYLTSAQWFRRRDQWFGEQEARTDTLRCMGCGRAATRRQLELHHLDYSRVTRIDDKWTSGEVHEDLCTMHPACHEVVHRVLDTDPVLRRYRARPIATIHAIRIAQTRLPQAGEKRA